MGVPPTWMSHEVSKWLVNGLQPTESSWNLFSNLDSNHTHNLLINGNILGL